jgi:hypothetical protein
MDNVQKHNNCIHLVDYPHRRKMEIRKEKGDSNIRR